MDFKSWQMKRRNGGARGYQIEEENGGAQGYRSPYSTYPSGGSSWALLLQGCLLLFLEDGVEDIDQQGVEGIHLHAHSGPLERR